MVALSMNDPIAIVGRTAVSQTRVMLDAYVVLNYEHLPLPTLAGEQQKIADCLTTLDALITAQTQKLAALKTPKKGLMQQLFPSPEEVEA